MLEEPDTHRCLSFPLTRPSMTGHATMYTGHISGRYVPKACSPMAETTQCSSFSVLLHWAGLSSDILAPRTNATLSGKGGRGRNPGISRTSAPVPGTNSRIHEVFALEWDVRGVSREGSSLVREIWASKSRSFVLRCESEQGCASVIDQASP